MIGMTFNAAKGSLFDREKVKRSVDADTRKVLSKFGAFVRQRAKTSIRKRKGTSPPGQPPYSHVGLLRKFIFFAYDPLMAVKLGLDARLYRNTGTYAAPVWNEVKNVKDVTLNLEAGEADVTTRGNAGWRATVATLKDGSIEFEMVWDTADDDFAAIRDTFLNRGSMEFAVMDGDITVSGSQGLRATCMVTNFSRNEALEEAITVSVTVKPTYSLNPPSWIVVP